MKIYNSTIGYGQPTFVIAELCSNVVRHIIHPTYSYSLDVSHWNLQEIVSLVAQTGASAAKIQLFKHTHFSKPEWESKKRVEFPRDRVREFIDLCHSNNLAAGASVFDDDAVDLLEQSGADFIKMATREWENINLWQRVLESPLPKIASFDVGNSRMINVPYAMNTIHLACVPQYPVIDPYIPRGYSVDSDWGWSSHTPDYLDCLLAVSRGACVIEKHIAFSETDFEHGWSLESNEFGQMVKDIRRVERMR